MSKIILALDGMNYPTAKETADSLKPYVAGGKANDLIDEVGARVLNKLGFRLRMADPKIKDIPATVRNRVHKYVQNADFVTVHGTNTYEALKAAKEGVGNSDLKVIAVTVTTDFNESQCRSVFGTRSVKKKVLQLVRRARAAGLHGIVCSPKEVNMVREQWHDAIIIVPGVRSQGANVHDQKRVGTPKQAIDDGANYIVCGREIIEQSSKALQIASAKRINDDIRG